MNNKIFWVFSNHSTKDLPTISAFVIAKTREKAISYTCDKIYNGKNIELDCYEFDQEFNEENPMFIYEDYYENENNHHRCVVTKLIKE